MRFKNIFFLFPIILLAPLGVMGQMRTDYQILVDGLKADSGYDIKSGSIVLGGRVYDLYEQVYDFDLKPGDDFDKLSKVLREIIVSSVGRWKLRFVQTHWISGPLAGRTTFVAFIFKYDEKNEKFEDIPQGKVTGEEFDPKKRPKEFPLFGPAKPIAPSGTYGFEGEKRGVGYIVNSPESVDVDGALGQFLTSLFLNKKQADNLKSLIEFALDEKIKYTQNIGYDVKTLKDKSDRRFSYSGWKNIIVSLSRRGIEDMRIILSGNLPVVLAPAPFIVERSGDGEVTLYARNLEQGKYDIKVLVTGDRSSLDIAARVEANYLGKAVIKNLNLSTSKLKPVIAQPPPQPSSAPPPLPEEPQPPSYPGATDFPGGSVLDRPIRTTHDTVKSREATEAAMEQIEEGSKLIQPPTFLEKVRNLWPFKWIQLK